MNLKAHAVLQNSVCLHDNNFPFSLDIPQQHCFVCLVQEKKACQEGLQIPSAWEQVRLSRNSPRLLS